MPGRKFRHTRTVMEVISKVQFASCDDEVLKSFVTLINAGASVNAVRTLNVSDKSIDTAILLDVSGDMVHFLRCSQCRIRRAIRQNIGDSMLLGLVVVVLAGIVQGSFATPMKRMPAWQWENSWLLFALSGLIVFPWIITSATVPHLLSVYSSVSTATLLKVTLFGLLWGAGATLFGLGIARVGLALGFAVILGITASFGSLIPMALLHPEQLLLTQGIALILGTLVMVVGLVLLAFAGQARERDLGGAAGQQSDFSVGLIICILSGIFSSMLNFAFVFGDDLRKGALQFGASNTVAANPIWALAVSGGFVANGVYCVHLLNKNHSWGTFTKVDTGYLDRAAVVRWHSAVRDGGSCLGCAR
jgi:L-rhamnose-H+ transport protein